MKEIFEELQNDMDEFFAEIDAILSREPEMTDEEYEKLVDQFDSFLKGWEKEYFKKNPKKKVKKQSRIDLRKNISDKENLSVIGIISLRVFSFEAFKLIANLNL